MSVSKLAPAGGANDFNIAITGTNTTVTFNKEYSSGGYSIVSSAPDNTMDIYAYNADGSLAAYTSTKSLSASLGFNKLVILGGTNGDLLSFTFKQTFISSAVTEQVTAGPFFTSVSTSSLPNADSTTVITGGNFATDVTATWSSTGTSSTYTSAVTRTSASSITVTRGNYGTLSVALSPWILTLSNPGINDPVGSSVNKFSFTMGTIPVWSTTSPLNSYTKNVAFSQTLVAADTEASAMTYTLASGTLPDGITLASNGVLSGTATVVTSHTPVIRATDAGGNTADRTFTFNNIGTAAPTFTSPAAGALSNGLVGTAYTVTFVATDDSGITPTYSLASGTLPTGLTLNGTTGVLSGTPSASGTFTFAINATDTNGTSTSRSFTAAMTQVVTTTITSTQTWTYPSNAVASAGVEALVVGGGGGGGEGNAAGGGGGGGALIYGTSTSLFTPGTAYTVTIGAGGVGARDDAVASTNGTATSIGSLIVANGGGKGACMTAPTAAAAGGSGGGGSGPSSNVNGGAGAGSAGTVPSGFTGYVSNGASWQSSGNSWGDGGGGGGAGGAAGSGSNWVRGPGRTYSITGSSVTYAAGGEGQHSSVFPGAGSAGAANTGNGGDGANDPTEAQRRPGGSGIVVIKYSIA